MAFDWGSFTGTIIASGGGGGILGWLAARKQASISRESQFEKRVDAELMSLRSKVAECERERQHVLLVMVGFRMIIPELRRLDPTNPVLRQVANALCALPPEDRTFEELITQLNDLPYTSERSEDDRPFGTNTSS